MSLCHLGGSPVPTVAPTSCAAALASHAWLASADGVVIIPPQLGECNVYTYTAVPTSVRLPTNTTTLRFIGRYLVDARVPSLFSDWTLDLPHPITLDLVNNEIREIPANAFAAFGQRLEAIILSRGAVATVDPNAFANLMALRVLTLTGNRALRHLPDGWLTGLSALETLDLSE